MIRKKTFESLGSICIQQVPNGFILTAGGGPCDIKEIIVLEHPDNRYLGASIKHFMETGEAIDPDEFAAWSQAK